MDRCSTHEAPGEPAFYALVLVLGFLLIPLWLLLEHFHEQPQEPARQAAAVIIQAQGVQP